MKLHNRTPETPANPEGEEPLASLNSPALPLGSPTIKVAFLFCSNYRHNTCTLEDLESIENIRKQTQKTYQ